MFLEIRECIQMQVDALLFPTELDKHRHACPCCVNKLSEEKVDSSMLFCIDGNESLKRHQRTRRVLNASGSTIMEDSTRPDSRARKSHNFLEQDEVDVYKNEVRKRGAQVSKVQYMIAWRC